MNTDNNQAPKSAKETLYNFFNETTGLKDASKAASNACHQGLEFTREFNGKIWNYQKQYIDHCQKNWSQAVEFTSQKMSGSNKIQDSLNFFNTGLNNSYKMAEDFNRIVMDSMEKVFTFTKKD